MTSLAVTRTTPRSAAASPDAVRPNAAADAAIASTCGASASAAVVGVEAARRAREQRQAERRFKRIDVTPDSWLGEPQPARRAGKTAVVRNLNEGAQLVPAWAHVESYENV